MTPPKMMAMNKPAYIPIKYRSGKFHWTEQLRTDNYEDVEAYKVHNVCLAEYSGKGSEARPISSIEMGLFEPAVLDRMAKNPDSILNKSPGMEAMVEAVFGKGNGSQRLFILSKSIGKLNTVSLVVWIYRVQVFRKESFDACVDLLFQELSRKLRRVSALFVVSSVCEEALSEKYREMGFFSLGGVPYMLAGKLWRQQRVRLKVWYCDDIIDRKLP